MVRIALALLALSASPARSTEPGPDIFGSVALPVASTPLDARWRRVSASPLDPGQAPWAALLADIRGQNPRSQAEAVNAWVNARITFQEDRQLFGEEDRWVTATQSLTRRRGDCEDYVIAKFQLLRAAGFDTHDLYMTVARDLIVQRDHALLLARVEGRFLVLDSRTDVIQQDPRGADYRPILTLALQGAWSHGYRVRLASSP